MEVVEKRVDARVIRRRKKVVPDEPAVPAESEAAASTLAGPVPTAGTEGSVPAVVATGETGIARVPGAADRLTREGALTVAGGPKAAVGPTVTEAEQKVHRPMRRRKSRAEWEMEDIRRAGGLRHYATEDLETLEAGGEDLLEPTVTAPVGDVAEPKAGGAELSAAETPAGGAELAAELSADEPPPELFAAESVPETPKRIPETPEAAPLPAPRMQVPRVYPTRADRVFRPTGGRRKRAVRRDLKKTQITQMKASKRIIRIEEQITVGDLSQRMGVKASDLIRHLMQLEIVATIHQTIDLETARLLAQEYGFEVEYVGLNEEALLATPAPASQDPAQVECAGQGRPPVVTVMGHVDHGKTSILDAVRKTQVAAGEAGGITQHIGASEVSLPQGMITFIDTPGHEAFTALRARGAQVTDLVVLVVAANDGVMPQTREAIDHAKAAEVPIVVAINKMDVPDANPDRVKRQLAECQVVPEEWGGDVPCVPVSAKTGLGINDLLELILLQAEMLELRADATLPAQGTVIEAKLDRGRGPVATLLVQSGTVRCGTPLVCGTCYGRVRALLDARGDVANAVGPGRAVEILGLNDVPTAGDTMVEAADEKSAKTIAESRTRKEREELHTRSARFSLEEFQRQLLAEGPASKSLSVIVKSDVQGSAEAVVAALARVGSDKASVKVVRHGVGGITESDVLLAAASHALIVGFNVAPEAKARRVAEQEGVEIKRYGIIYELIDDITKALVGLLEPHRVEKILGHADVREIFHISKVGTIAGCAVVEGRMTRSGRARLLRDSVVVFEGRIGSLKRFKDDAGEVAEGFECGIAFDGYQDLKPGDVIESFVIEETAASL